MTLLIALSVFYLSSPAISFEQAFSQEYQEGLKYISQNKRTINSVVQQGEFERKMMVAIVFPEIVRYSLFKDFFETKFLDIGYVNFGSDVVDFSIGRFQMKPSFVEDLEKEIAKVNTLKYRYAELLTAEDSSTTWRRQVRVNRLSSLAGQLSYLSGYFALMEHKYGCHYWVSDVSKLRFYATAYNHGFTKSKSDIQKWECIETFPYGMSFKGSQYSYADLTIDYYQRIK